MQNDTAALEGCVVLSYKTNLPSPIDLGINLLDSYKNGLKSQIAHGLTHRELGKWLSEPSTCCMYVRTWIWICRTHRKLVTVAHTCITALLYWESLGASWPASLEHGAVNNRRSCFKQGRKQGSTSEVALWTPHMLRGSIGTHTHHTNTHTTHRQTHTDT